MMRSFSAIRVQHLGSMVVVWLLVIATAQAEESRSAFQSARYIGLLQGAEIVNGEMALQVSARGSERTVCDWSEVSGAFTALTWDNGQPAVSGMALNEDRKSQYVLIPQDRTTLKGAWSHRGERQNGRVVFDMVFPPCLSSTLELMTPSSVEVSSVNGVVQVENSTQREMKKFVIEFSGSRLRLAIQAPVEVSSQKAKCALDTLYVLRRDGVFIQSVIAVESSLKTLESLQLELPRTADIEGITSGGIRLDFERVADQSDVVRIPLNHVDPRFTVRVQAFQPLRWNRRKLLPKISVENVTIEQHQVTLRAEKPLEIVTVNPQGFLPTGLTIQGEVIQRQFKAYMAQPQLFVDAQFPEPELEMELQVYAEESGRSIALIDISAVQGQTFESVLNLPDSCDVVSVRAADSKSQVAAWRQTAGKLEIEYREPVVKGEQKSIFVTAQSMPPNGNVFLVTFPVANDLGQKSARVFVGTPDGYSATVDAEGWNSSVSGEMDERLQKVAHATEKLTVLEHNGSSVWNWPYMIFETPDPEDEMSIVNRGPTPPLTGIQDVIARSQLSTDLGPTRTSELIHHYTAELSAPVPGSDLQIDLSPDARISSVVIDDEVVSVLRTGEKLDLPRDVTTIKRLELVYWTQRKSTPIKEVNQFSVPELSIPVSQLMWTVRAPASQRIASLRMGDTSLESEAAEYLGTKFFGPLSQVYWLRKRPDLERSSSQQLFLPASNKNAAIEIWDTALLEQLSWIAFVACLMTGVGLRLFHIKWISTMSLVWLLTLSCLLIWLPPALSVLVGGMVSGTVISLILPRKLIHARDFMATIPDWPPTRATVVLLAIGLLGTSAQAQSTTSAPLNVKCLLTSATYQIVSFTPSTEVVADFDVICLQPDLENQIVLPLTGITFPQGGTCQVDGEQATLIPTLDGSGYVVTLPASPRSERSIQIKFAVRPNEREVDEVLWEIGIPPVVNATLISPITADIEFQHYGASISDGENARVQLGAIERLIAKRVVPRTSSAVRSLVSVVRLNPLHASGRCFVEVGQGSTCTLNFPPTFDVSKVVGSVDAWNTTIRDDGSIDVFVRLNQSEPRGLEIDFELPISQQAGKVQIPVFPIDHASTSHVLGLVAEPGFHIEPMAGSSRVSLEAWNSLNLPFRSRPTSVVRVLSEPVELEIERLKPVCVADIAETITVQRKELQWQADVTIDVQKIPVFEQVFRVDRELTISSIEHVEDNNNKLGVWKRSGERLALVIPNGQVGTAQYRLTGTMPLSAEVWRTIPEFMVEETDTQSQNLIIKDGSGWNLQLETAAGTNIQANAFRGQPNSRIVGTYAKANRPFRIRISPPASLTSYEVVSYLRFLPGVDPEMMSTFQFFAEDVPLRKVDIQVPHGLKNVRVRPSHLRRTTMMGTDSDILTLRWGAGRQSSAVTISGQWDLDVADPFLPQAKSNSSQDRFLLLAADSPMTITPATGRVCAEDDLPDWADRIVRLAKREGSLECYQLIGDKLDWETRVTHSMRPPTLVESLVWPQSTAAAIGRSNIWFAPGHQFTIELPFRDGVRVTRVMDILGNSIPFNVDGGILTVKLDQQDHAMISVMWSSAFLDGVRPPFQTTADTQQILGIWKDEDLRASSTPDEDWTIRLARCQAMFAALRDARVSISLDSPLMQQVRQLVSELELASEELDESHPLSPMVLGLLSDWKDLQREIAITADDPVPSSAVVAPVDGLLEGHIAFDWWVTDPNWTVDLAPQKTSLVAPILATCLAVLVWGGLLFRFEGQFRNLADHLARYPGLILILLGMLWAMLLSPAQMGYALMGVGLVSELIRWFFPEIEPPKGRAADVEN